MSWRRRDPDDIALVEGSEAFLAGTYVELCESRGKAVPVWAWMNLLAHGTEGQLRDVAVQHRGVGPWHHARRLVASELVDLIVTGRVALPEFQREVLVPLELDIMGCPGANAWRPGQFASGLLGALPDSGRRRRGALGP